MRVHVPPIKCQGIKTKLVPYIRQCVSWKNEGKWIEPFAGSGVVGFNMQPSRAEFYDSNPCLIDFYRSLADGVITPSIARRFLEAEGKKLADGGADYYYSVRERFNKTHAPLDFLFLNRSCFNGLIRFNRSGGFNVPFGHKPNRFSKAYVTKIVNQIEFVCSMMMIREWKFEVQNFVDAFSRITSKDFVYCDPPYAGRHVDYYDSWSEEDEHKLHRLLKSCPAKFILSTWHSNEHRHNPFMDSLWSEFNVLTIDHYYHVGAKETNRKPMKEAIVANFEFKLPISNKHRVDQLWLNL